MAKFIETGREILHIEIGTSASFICNKEDWQEL
jgi:hypothetical protein